MDTLTTGVGLLIGDWEPNSAAGKQTNNKQTTNKQAKQVLIAHSLRYSVSICLTFSAVAALSNGGQVYLYGKTRLGGEERGGEGRGGKWRGNRSIPH